MFHTLFYEPVYNLLVVVLTFVPLHDIGAAIVLVTLIVKFFLLPLNLSALRTQYLMKRLEPEMNKIKELQKTKPQEASKMMIDLYIKEGVNPFASIFTVILQIPIFFALYFVFSKGLFSDPESLYSFVSFPEKLHTLAFGLFDVTQKNIPIAVLVGLSSYILARRQTVEMVSKKEKHEESFQDHFMKSMRIQLLYVLPIIIGVSSAVLPSALGLYWFTSNVVGYAQDVYMKNKLSHLHPSKHNK
ncbi:YidC/Oxa1 family membrane protein insertase [Candidatus Gracilibacteria bacterium]|nr:YidC/Oxa1 family membrane protein insertase [Candidatus Gracilibacteria bacterium]MCF7898524.1 YidC/Oxa1 family membrane protein insertase [Candidatus Paceibacterota bacterium]